MTIEDFLQLTGLEVHVRGSEERLTQAARGHKMA